MEKDINPEMYEVNFEVNTVKGRGELQAGFVLGEQNIGAYYIYIEPLK